VLLHGLSPETLTESVTPHATRAYSDDGAGGKQGGRRMSRRINKGMQAPRQLFEA
jgi:hypothetical protein